MIDKIRGLGAIGGISSPTETKKLPDIKDFAKVLDELQAFEDKTNSIMKEVAAGNLDKLPEAITMASQLDLAVQMIIQVRNKLMAGFQEFTRITM